MKFWYVYVLRIENSPVYVGMTSNPLQRYICHYFTLNTITGSFLRNHYFHSGVTANMQLLYKSKSKLSIKYKEMETINKFSDSHTLLNIAYNNFVAPKIKKYRAKKIIIPLSEKQSIINQITTKSAKTYTKRTPKAYKEFMLNILNTAQ